jgi:hypothetical protein
VTFDPQEIPRVCAWMAKFGDAFDVDDYLDIEAGADRAVAFTRLYWPAFVEVRGCVLLANRYTDENLEEWWQSLGGDRRAIEVTINHVHLRDVFPRSKSGVPDEGLSHLAEVLGKTWGAAAREQFPDREFVVSVTGEPEDYGPTITVHSV